MAVALPEQDSGEPKPLPRRAQAETFEQGARLEARGSRNPDGGIFVETIHDAPRFPAPLKTSVSRKAV
jgi:hypothetical protein